MSISLILFEAAFDITANVFWSPIKRVKDAIKIGVEISTGNYIGALIDTAFYLIDLFTVGCASAAKNAGKKVSEQFMGEAIQTGIKEAGKSTSKRVQTIGSKFILENVVEQGAKEISKNVTEKAGYKIFLDQFLNIFKKGGKYGGSLIQNIPKYKAGEAIKNTITSNSKELFKSAINKGQKEFLKTGFKESVKGEIKSNFIEFIAKIIKSKF